MTDRDRLRTLCQAIYGEDWISPFARTMGIALRTAQRWAAGTYPVPSWVWGSPELAKATSEAYSVLLARLAVLVENGAKTTG